MADERLHFTDASSNYNAMGASEHVVRYHCVRSLCRGKRVLDVACGEGYGSALLAKWGAAEVVGIDASNEAIVVARQLFAQPNMKFLQGDACRLTELLGDTPRFDLVVSFETIEHVTDPPRLLAGIRRYSAPGGTVVVSCPNDHVEDGDNPYHVRRYTFEEFRDAATAVLGPATGWLLGTPAHGVLLYPAGDPRMENAQETRMTLLTECSELPRAAVLPSQRNLAPQSTTCKFYVGYWGGPISEDAVVSAQSYPAFSEPWRSVAWLKQELGDKPALEVRFADLQVAKAAVDRQLAELRRRTLVYGRMARADLQRATAEVERIRAEVVQAGTMVEQVQAELMDALKEVEQWREFRRSHTYRLLRAYIACYSLPLIGPILHRARRVTANMLRGGLRARTHS